MKTFTALSVLVATLLVCSPTSAVPLVKCGVVTPTAGPALPVPVPVAPSSAPATTPPAPIATLAPSVVPAPASNVTTAPSRDETGGESDIDEEEEDDTTVEPPTQAPNTTSPTTSAPTFSPSVTTPATRDAVVNSAGCGKAATIKSGAFTTTINGKERQYTVRVPMNYDSSKAYRFVLAFHWLGGTMQNVAGFGGYYGLQSLSAESTIFVAPQGLNNAWPNSGGEDLAFVDYLVKTIDEGLCVNQNLRFATGFSYGGSMTHSVACSRAKDFRAVAVLSGGQFSGCSDGTTPIAYLITHGVSDTTIPIAQMRSMRDKFVKTNGCTAQSATEPAAGSGTHVKTEYKGCSAGHPVVAIAFDGSHTFAPADKGARTVTFFWGRLLV